MTPRSIYEAEVMRVWGDGNDGAHDIWHLRRVWRNCQQIEAALDTSVNMTVLEAAAFLHDVINLPKNAADRHRAASLSAEHAASFLAKRDWPVADIRNVMHAIEAHSFSAGVMPISVEARILQDADRLEALGAIGIARCFNVSGQIGGQLFDGEDPLARSRVRDDKRFALDHFETKLYRIAETMQTDPGLRMATARVEVMRRFVEDLLTEIA